MAQKETPKQLIELFAKRLEELQDGGSESIDLDEASEWVDSIRKAVKAEHGNGGDHDGPYRRG